MNPARPVALVDLRVGTAVDVLLTGRLTLLQRRALAELLVVATRPGGEELATAHASAVDALATEPAHRRGRPREP